VKQEMIIPEDIKLLKDMRMRVVAFREGLTPFVGAADNLAILGENLHFRDREWEDRLNQQIVTLDSASTFVPKNAEQSEQAVSAIKTAVEEILGLIDEKLSSQ
jgi:hypothetical protein